jgi:hypothetical protein
MRLMKNLKALGGSIAYLKNYSEYGRAIFANGFPKEYSLEDLEKFWFARSSAITLVKVLKPRSKKPSQQVDCYVVFTSEEECQKAIQEKLFVNDKEIQVNLKVEKPKYNEENVLEEEPFKKGSCLALSGLDASLHPLNVKRILTVECSFLPSFVEKKNSGEFLVRFADAVALQVAEEIQTKEIKFKDGVPQVRVLEGEEEKSYLQESYKAKCEHLAKSKNLKGKRKKKVDGKGKSKLRKSGTESGFENDNSEAEISKAIKSTEDGHPEDFKIPEKVSTEEINVAN